MKASLHCFSPDAYDVGWVRRRTVEVLHSGLALRRNPPIFGASLQIGDFFKTVNSTSRSDAFSGWCGCTDTNAFCALGVVFPPEDETDN